MKQLLCKILGHKWLYNFMSMPNKRICSRCYKKEKWKNIPYVFDDTFTDKRTDKQLINAWHKL